MTEQNQTPPWGDDANFDASKAWSLIQNLRAEVDGLKTAKTALAAERDDALAKVQGAEDDLARVFGLLHIAEGADRIIHRKAGLGQRAQGALGELLHERLQHRLN